MIVQVKQLSYADDKLVNLAKTKTRTRMREYQKERARARQGGRVWTS